MIGLGASSVVHLLLEDLWISLASKVDILQSIWQNPREQKIGFSKCQPMSWVSLLWNLVSPLKLLMKYTLEFMGFSLQDCHTRTTNLFPLLIPEGGKALRLPKEYWMASCSWVAASGDYSLKQKEGEKKVNAVLAASNSRSSCPSGCRDSAQWLECRWFSAYPSGLPEEKGFGGNTILNLNFWKIDFLKLIFFWKKVHLSAGANHKRHVACARGPVSTLFAQAVFLLS